MNARAASAVGIEGFEAPRRRWPDFVGYYGCYAAPAVSGGG